MKRLLTLLIGLALLAGVATAVPEPQSAPQQTDQKKDVTVYVTRTGKKYHRAGCSALRSSSIPISLKDAKAKGYTALQVVPHAGTASDS